MKRFVWLLLIAQPLLAIDFQNPRSLADSAIENHPSMARLRAELAAAGERVAPAESLPNPMLMAGVQNKQIDLRDDPMMTMYMIGASQRLIRPEKREARRNAARLEVARLEQEQLALRAGIERDVLLAWYDVAVADAQLAAAENVRAMNEAIVAASRVRYEVGDAAQADVIRAQLQASDLEREILALRGMRRAALAALLPMLELPLDTGVPALALPADAASQTIAAPPLPPDDHPAIVALRHEVARADEDVRLARAELKPDIDLEAQYGYRRLERDLFTLTARVELPLRSAQTLQPRVREAILARDAATARIAELRRTLTAAMAAAAAEHEDATRQLQYHEQVLVPQAQLAFDSTLAAYQTGKASFDAILGAEAALLQLRLRYYELVGRHARAVVSFDALRRGSLE